MRIKEESSRLGIVEISNLVHKKHAFFFRLQKSDNENEFAHFNKVYKLFSIKNFFL